MIRGCGALLSTAAVLFTALGAQAQLDERRIPARRAHVGSPEWFAFELRGGPYRPDEAGVGDVFGDDNGPLLGFELDALLLRIPYVGQLGIGSGLGWSRYSAKAFAPDGTRSNEDTSLTLIPMPILGVVRIDVLPRQLGIPFIFAGKLGLDMIFWSSSTGERDDGSGVAFGLRWGVQVALELDFFDPPAARTLDEEWGINHTYVLFEVFGSTAADDFTVGDPLTWALGLGFII